MTDNNEQGTPELALLALADVQGYIENSLPDGRAKSLALTKLDEARFWAQEACND